MALSVLHALTCTIADAPVSELEDNAVRPSDWNDQHVLTVSAASILGATGAGAVSQLTAAQARSVLSVYSAAEIDASFQPLDTDLTVIAGLSRARGDLITGGASAWQRLALGTSGYALLSDGTDSVWAGFVQQGTSASTRAWQAKIRDYAISITDFGAVAGGSAATNATAIQAAITAAAAANKALYIPGASSTYQYDTTLNLTTLIPIVGDGKDESRLSYTGAGVGLLIQPAAESFVATAYIPGHWMMDFELEPSVANAGTYGIEIRLAADRYYGAFSWYDLRIGRWGTKSIYLNNSVANTDGFFTGYMVGCHFGNGMTWTNVGDNIKMESCRVTGSGEFAVSMMAGARSLVFEDMSILNSGGVSFASCNGVHFERTHQEIISGTDYNGSKNACLYFNDCSQITIKDSRLAKVGTGTKPDNTISFAGTTSFATVENVELAKGNSTHILAATTTSDIYCGKVAVDTGVGNEVVSLLGLRSTWINSGVTVLGDAAQTLVPNDKIIITGAALTANRALILPRISDVRLGHEIVFHDAGVGFGGFAWVITRAGADTIFGSNTLNFGTNGSTIRLRAAAAGVWTYDLLPAGYISGGQALSKVDDTNVTLTLGGSPTTAILAATSLTLGWTGTLAVSRGGTGDAGTAWASYTPTIAAQSGTYTTTSTAGAYKQIGKMVFFRAQATITTNGTAASALLLGLPVAQKASTEMAVMARNVTNGKMFGGRLQSALGTYAYITLYDGNYGIADGDTIVATGVYEAA